VAAWKPGPLGWALLIVGVLAYAGVGVWIVATMESEQSSPLLALMGVAAAGVALFLNRKK